MGIQEIWGHWKLRASEDPGLVRELEGLHWPADEAEIRDRFCRDLEFGTGGLRGVLGAGTARMNIYTVRRATQALADHLIASGLPRSVAIARDSRIGGELFCQECARVLAANGIAVWMYPRLEPTPALSWAVRYYHCGAGVCITASHNPAEYNGYKVYGPDGGQITPTAAEQIYRRIRALDPFDGPKRMDLDEAVRAGQVRWIPDQCLSDLVDAILDLRPRQEDLSDLSVVYTPLNGSGLEAVQLLLRRMGAGSVTVVPEQAAPDGRFPTCPRPDPEVREALERGMALCREIHADLLLATDPDCDRMGAAVPDRSGEPRPISGDEMGVLLLDYLCRARTAAGTMPRRPVAVTTIVSTDMASAVAGRYGVELRRTLTGFKYIGEQIGLLEAAGEADRFLFGFEESYGYLSGAHVRDKDAVDAVMLACDAAAWYRERGMTLLDGLDALYEEHGWYRNRHLSRAFPGEQGRRTMEGVVASLRERPPKEIGGLAVERIMDYLTDETGLPPSNVLELHLAGHAKVLIRPSGTEPKLKLYLSSREKTAQGADAVLERLSRDLEALLSRDPDSGGRAR